MLVCATANLDYSTRSWEALICFSVCNISLKKKEGGARRVVWSTVKQTQVHKWYGGYLISSSESSIFSGLITTIKNVCVKASHFVKSPKTVSLTLYLSALNTEVAKTAQAACFFVFFKILFCIFQTIMSYALLLYTVHWNSFTKLVQSHFCPGDSKLKDGIF